MTDSRTLPIVGAAMTAPAWLPALAAIAPPLIIGTVAVAGLVWLFSDDDKPKPATATPEGNRPPAPNPPAKQERGFWDSSWNDGCFTKEEAKSDMARCHGRNRSRHPVPPAPVPTMWTWMSRGFRALAGGLHRSRHGLADRRAVCGVGRRLNSLQSCRGLAPILVCLRREFSEGRHGRLRIRADLRQRKNCTPAMNGFA